MARRSEIATDNTLPVVDNDYDPDLDPAVDRVYSLPPVKWSKAGRMDFADEDAQREYLRLVNEFEKPPAAPFFDGRFFAGVAAAATLGAVVGLIWRAHRKNAALKTHGGGHVGGGDTGVLLGGDGLDDLGAS